MSDRGNTAENLLLQHIPVAVRKALRAEVVECRVTEKLFSGDETPEFTYFPDRGAVVSVVRSTADGAAVEAGVVSSEGLISLHNLIVEPGPTGSEGIVQSSGTFVRIPVAGTRAHFQNDARFRDAVLAFTSSFLQQVTQNSVCNRLHQIEQRLAKWLLLVRERVPSDELQLTHEFMAHMLGIHRPGVSIAVQELELDGLIAHGRNRIRIVNREGLQKKACECFPQIHANLRDLRASLAP
ncbi:MAG: Crp/Fnr family transcriptional regulator [Acidobacteriota bacterium]|nr:Crp/Fnr family transcriptional regulator [Acidobacteriota bacterium]